MPRPTWTTSKETFTGFCEHGDCTEQGRLYRRDPETRGQIFCTVHARAHGFTPGEKPVDRNIPRGNEDWVGNRKTYLEPEVLDAKRRAAMPPAIPLEEVDEKGNVLARYADVRAAAAAIGCAIPTLYQALQEDRACKDRRIRKVGTKTVPRRIFKAFGLIKFRNGVHG